MAYPKIQKGDKAKNPRPGIPLKKSLDKKVVLNLIKESHGNLSHVADACGTTRGAIRRWCDNDDELKSALEDARERIIDKLEKSCWDDAIENRDTALRCFLLKTQARHRGYDQDESKNAAKDIATAAFNFIINKQSESK